MKRIFFSILIIFTTLFLTSCSPPKKSLYETDEGFLVEVTNPQGCFNDGIETCNDVHIIQLLDQELDKETIYFPVTLLGIDNVVVGAFSTGAATMFTSENIKYAYINGENTTLSYHAFTYFDSIEAVIVNSITNRDIYNEFLPLGIKTIIPHEVDMDSFTMNDFESVFKYVKKSRVSYFYNYENSPNDGLYTIGLEVVGDGEVLSVPAIPERDGYNFLGWYQEKECINLFDFDQDGIEELEKVELFAKWDLK